MLPVRALIVVVFVDDDHNGDKDGDINADDDDDDVDDDGENDLIRSVASWSADCLPALCLRPGRWHHDCHLVTMMMAVMMAMILEGLMMIKEVAKSITVTLAGKKNCPALNNISDVFKNQLYVPSTNQLIISGYISK